MTSNTKMSRLRQHFGCHDMWLVNLAQHLALVWHLRIVHPEELIPFSRESSFTRRKNWCNCFNCSAPTAEPQMSTAWHTDTAKYRGGIESLRAPVLLFLRLCIQARPWQRSCGPAPAAHADSADCISYISRLYQGYTKDTPRISMMPCDAKGSFLPLQSSKEVHQHVANGLKSV